MSQEQLIYSSRCWGCKRATEDPTEQYICPKSKEHLKEYEKYERN